MRVIHVALMILMILSALTVLTNYNGAVKVAEVMCPPEQKHAGHVQALASLQHCGCTTRLITRNTFTGPFPPNGSASSDTLKTRTDGCRAKLRTYNAVQNAERSFAQHELWRWNLAGGKAKRRHRDYTCFSNLIFLFTLKLLPDTRSITRFTVPPLPPTSRKWI